MSTFDSYADSPFQIRTEGQEITIKFSRTGPTTGRISWNIPVPALGCSADDQAYDGIVVTLDNTHTSPDKSPVNGTKYTADPTGDVKLHAGDKIGTALVVGAFYDDKTTTFFDITGLTEDYPVFVSGHAVDKVYRYHIEGVHTYSLDYEGGNELLPVAAYQEVELGISGAALTGLTPATAYDFIIDVDGTEHTIVVNGNDTGTYDQLLAALIAEIGKIQNPTQGPMAPNTSAYYWDATKEVLYQWDGTQHIITNVIVEDTAPNLPSAGDYWYNTTNGVLSKWTGSPLAWTTEPHISYSQDPTSLDGNDYWFNGTKSFIWDGTTWCEKTTWNQATDPSLPVYPSFGTYWYDNVNLFLNKWNDQTNSWTLTDAIYWNVDPNSLTTNTYWFDETNNILKQWNGTSFVNLTATISSTEPATPAPNTYWYNATTEELKQRDPANTIWVDKTVLVFADDPTSRATCDLWWDSLNDLLYVWDINTSTWDLITNFLQQAIDPAAPPVLTTEDVWYNSTDETLTRWDGSMWATVTFINYATDPTIISTGDVWFDVANNVWNEWTGSWTPFDPTEAIADPAVPAIGVLWFDRLNTLLNQWTGSAWTTITFTTIPLTPSVGTLWFDTANNVLKEWDGKAWITSSLDVVLILTTAGDLRFTSRTTGTSSSISLTDGILFASLAPVGVIQTTVPGTDGITPTPMYQQIGIGDDGTTDERRELMDSIRQQLGYPVVDVELTKYQLDTAVTAALESLRKRSSSAYNRGFFFVDVPHGQQNLILTNEIAGFNKIVTVMGAYRITSSFLKSAYGSGVFGQVVLQHLYTMGTYDLVSYHLMSQYIEQLEALFATRLVYQWIERTRALNFYQTFSVGERILLDASVERTEQDLLTDRWTKSWIEKYASAQARLMLAEIRGKYASLPGAGGGVSLNAGELITRAESDMAECYDQLDNMVVNHLEEFGMGSQFLIG